MPKWSVHHGDCLEVMRSMPDASIDAVVTDPPYHLTTGKRGGSGPASICLDTPAGRARIGTGFMGKAWDGGDIAHRPEVWAEAIRLCKPGAHLLAFGGTRTYHRLVCAVEDAGWEIRDQIGWAFGSGFPKSLNLDGEWDGWGTALKPAWEPIVVARKPLIGTVAENVEKHGTGALNIDGCRVPFAGGDDKEQAKPQGRATTKANGAAAATPDAGRGVERINFPIKQSDRGRWPANLIHDGSPEVLACFPQTASGKMRPTHTTAGRAVFGQNADGGYTTMETYGDTGSAARFFYVPKADREDRNAGLSGREETPLHWSSGDKNPGSFQSPNTKKSAQNSHPTVKPTDLMRYLCRLITPPGGTVLDPFMGSGSTGRGSILEGFSFVGIEQDATYIEIARRRIEAVCGLFSGPGG